MRALVQTAPRTLEMREVPAPEADVVRVAHCGVCGSDMHAFAGHDPRRPVPLTLGHEVVGRDASGRAMAVNPLVTCGACRWCREGRDNLCPSRAILSMPPREGGFAEAVASPAANNVPVPEGVPLAAAALAEPLACGWHAVRLAARVAPLGEALVLGGGAIGLGAALALAAQGAARVVVVELNPARADRLRGLPGIEVSGEGTEADTVIDAVGIDATRAASFALVRPGGVVAHIGLGPGTGGFDARRATLQEIAWLGTYTYTAEDFRETGPGDLRRPAARRGSPRSAGGGASARRGRGRLRRARGGEGRGAEGDPDPVVDTWSPPSTHLPLGHAVGGPIRSRSRERPPVAGGRRRSLARRAHRCGGLRLSTLVREIIRDLGPDYLRPSNGFGSHCVIRPPADCFVHGGFPVRLATLRFLPKRDGGGHGTGCGTSERFGASGRVSERQGRDAGAALPGDLAAGAGADGRRDREADGLRAALDRAAARSLQHVRPVLAGRSPAGQRGEGDGPDL